MADTIFPTSVADLITTIRADLNEVTERFFLDTQLTNWIKEAALEMSATGLLYQATDLLTLVADTLEYTTINATPMSAVVKVQSCLYQPGAGKDEGMVEIKAKQIGHLAKTAKGPPQFWCHYAGRLIVLPLTTASIVSGGGKIKVYFAQVTDDITLFADKDQLLVKPYVLSRALFKEKKYGASMSEYMRFFNTLVLRRGDVYGQPADAKEDLEVPDRTR